MVRLVPLVGYGPKVRILRRTESNKTPDRGTHVAG
jgi:hypothetical protein